MIYATGMLTNYEGVEQNMICTNSPNHYSKQFELTAPYSGY
jgi:hypothetical protein